MLSILTFVIVLSILVLVHEAGHFYAARRAGVLVEEFGFGLPPRVWGKKVGETLYSINLLPFGGFVRLHGENVEEGITQPKRAFLNQDKKTRTSIIVAGVVMNFILAVVAFAIVYSFAGIPRNTNQVRVIEVSPDSPAEEAGLDDGDVILAVEGVDVTNTVGFINEVDQYLGKDILISYMDDDTGEVRETSLVPRENPPENEGAMGIVISSIETYFPPIWQRPFYGIYSGLQEAFFWGSAVLTGFGTMLVQLFRGDVPSEVAGPVGIYALTSEAAQFGILTLINFLGILSINLAILNVLPFPALDGGRLLFIVIEAVVGKKVVPRVEALVHTVGIVILILLILAITATDISRLIEAGGVSGYLDTLIPE